MLNWSWSCSNSENWKIYLIRKNWNSWNWQIGNCCYSMIWNYCYSMKIVNCWNESWLNCLISNLQSLRRIDCSGSNWTKNCY